MELAVDKRAGKCIQSNMMRDFRQVQTEEHMKKIIAVIAIILGTLITIAGLIATIAIMRAKQAASVGIIGGADGPTAVFMTTSPNAVFGIGGLLLALLGVVLLIIGIVVYLVIKKK